MNRFKLGSAFVVQYLPRKNVGEGLEEKLGEILLPLKMILCTGSNICWTIHRILDCAIRTVDKGGSLFFFRGSTVFDVTKLDDEHVIEQKTGQARSSSSR